MFGLGFGVRGRLPRALEGQSYVNEVRENGQCAWSVNQKKKKNWNQDQGPMAGRRRKEEEGSWINGRRQCVCVERDERESNEASKVTPPFSRLASRAL